MSTYARYPKTYKPLEGQGVRAQSGLPDGGAPSSKGLSLDDKIPGTSTFNKEDENHTRDFDKPDEKSMYEVDGPDDMLTKYKDVNEDNAGKHNGIGYFGLGPTDERNPKTRYPYRNDRPNEKSASALYVVESWLADTSPIMYYRPSLRVALRMDDIVNGINPKLVERGSSCSVSLSRFDRKNMRWTFSVNCGNGPKVVKMKASRKGRVTNFSKLDLEITCSCPAWRWQGPEHWSKSEKYLDGKPRGTATVPVIRDPLGVNRVCKHVYASMLFAKAWTIPLK